MNLPDDMLPEEREPQYAELITLLQQAYSKPVSVSLERQQQILSRVRARLMQADLETSPTEDTSLAVLGTMNSSSNKPKTLIRKHLLSTLVAVLLMVVLLGTTLLFLGSWLSTTDGHSTGGLSLDVIPSIVSVNRTITLHGSHFSSNAHVGLMRDMDIAIVDTHDHNIISADSSGSFTDTVFVDANYWEPGAHIIYAEDAISHKTASFPIMVIGHGASLPPHLVLSQTSLDLGSGDLATNSTASMTVADSGGGVISWQSATTQPWLVLSPTHGTISDGRGMQLQR